MPIDTYTDNNFNRNNPHSIHAQPEPIEELTNEQFLEQEAGRYQRKYMMLRDGATDLIALIKEISDNDTISKEFVCRKLEKLVLEAKGL